MSVLDPKKTYKNLKKKGFIDSITKSVDHKHMDFFHNEKYILSTKISHGKKDIDNVIVFYIMLTHTKVTKTINR